MFDAALIVVDKDISRTLNAFYATEPFFAYFENKPLFDDLLSGLENSQNGKETLRSRSKTVGVSSREEVVRAVREAYGKEGAVTLERIFDITSPYHYRVHDGPVSGTVIGYGVERKGQFYFHNSEEELLLKMSAAALAGKEALGKDSESVPKPTAQVALHDDDVAGSGCCGSAPSAAPHAPAAAVARAISESQTWYIQDSKQQHHGPFSHNRMQLLWRFHMLPESVLISADAKNWDVVDNFPQFPPSKRVELVDPTNLGN